MGLFSRKKFNFNADGEHKAVSCNHHQYEWTEISGDLRGLKELRCVICGRDKKRGMICHLCEHNKTKLKNNDLMQEKNQLFHRICQKNKKQLMTRDLVSNLDFVKRKFIFDEGLEKLIHVSYQTPQEIDVKLFFNENDWSIYSRNYTEKIEHNSIRVIIEAGDKKNSSILVSGGNFDFNDDFDSGYTLLILLEHGDKKLLKHIGEKLRSKGWGCLPSTFSIMAHLNDVKPTNDNAKTIVSEITDELSNSIKQMNAPY
jgi:hypothetical protein